MRALACVALAFAALAGSPVILEPPTSQTVFLGDPVTFRVGASGTAPLSYQWFCNGTAVGGATTSNLTFTTTASDHHAQFSVQVTNTAGAATSESAVLWIDFGMPGPSQTNRVIAVTNVWRYNVSKANLGTSWTAPGYADGGWASGGGLLYVEESAMPAPKTTALPLTAGSLPTTCYFRTWFTNPCANVHSLSLVANAVIDDGAVFHLNGAEAFRLGMPTTGTVSYSTPANRTQGNASWEGLLDFPTTNLVGGANVLAAEVHQNATNSTDIVLGLTLDVVWQDRLRDTMAPVVTGLVPASGEVVSTLTQIGVQFSEAVQGVDAADLRVNGVAATNRTVVAPNEYQFHFPQPVVGTVNVRWSPDHRITDRAVDANAFDGAGFGYVLVAASSATRLSFLSVRQSQDASSAHTADKAVDGVISSFSLTANEPGSSWLGELGRPYPLERIEVVNRASPDDAALEGLLVRLCNMDDQVVFESTLANPGPAGIAMLSVPPGVRARSLWIGLPGTQTNGAGHYRVGLAEVRAYGVPDIPYGPESVTVPTNGVRVWQSSEYGGFPAENAVDGDTSSFTHTANLADSCWMADLGRAVRMDRIEIVNRDTCCDKRLGNLVLRVFDGASNSVSSAVLTNPGLGGTWTHLPASGIEGRWLRVGLENGQANQDGNYYVTLAEARVYSGATNVLVLSSGAPVPVVANLASFKPSCMLRLDETVPVASQANDDNYATETKTTLRTVDGYWEVDLGATCALYGVRAIAASGIGSKLTNTIVRLFNEAHESVLAKPMTGTPDAFDLDLNGPVFARHVRIGLEDKQRTDPSGGIEFYIGFREVEVFGRPTNQIGILSFSASTNQAASGQPVTLSWAVDEVRRVEIHPALGSVGAQTATNGVGLVPVTMEHSTEFVLIATNAAGLFSSAVSVQVAADPLLVRLSEIVADNKYSLKDGDGDASDWIELRNPGDAPVDLTGWGLSDRPAQPMKWTFPAAHLAPHGTLIVFASGRETPWDAAGNLHANFRLEKNGGALVLTGSDGVTTLDRLPAYPEMDVDLAYGRDLEGEWTFLEPTPRAVNAAPAYLGWLKPLDWSHARGFYETGFTLTLTNPNPGATVYYSRDGSEPTVPYARGIAITGTTALRAQAVRTGYRPARVQTQTFLFVDDVITSSVMNTAITQNPTYAPRLRPGLLALPSISLCLPGEPEYAEKEGSLEVLWPNGGEPVQVHCGLSRFGNAWTKYDKRSFRMKCRARYGEAKLNGPLFNGFDRGVLAKTSFDELDLRSGSQDMVERGFYMAGRFVEDSMLDMGSLNPHGRFVHVYVNGVYWGQYDCRELLKEHFMADYLGGAEEDYVAVRGNDNVGDDFVLGAPEPPNLESWESLRASRKSYETARSWLDVSHLIDFMLLWNYGNAESEFRACGPIGAGSGFKFWIADADGFLRPSALGSNRTSREGPGGLFGGLVSENHKDFRVLRADRIYKHFFNNGALTRGANDARLAARMQEIHDSLVAECARWGYRTPADWESAAATIRSSLFPTRTTQLLGYLRSAGLYPAFDPPTFNPYGGVVADGFTPILASASGTIYYTLDGTDPRLPGGGISPTARAWSPGAVTMTHDLTLNVRVRTALGEWSALAQPRYLIASRCGPTARDLLVTEINYNPAGSDAFEFIELQNVSTNLLDLSGVSLSNAVHFVFPSGSALAPGAFVIVVENAESFALRYQTPGSSDYYPGLVVAGEWSGALNNTGETLSLVASNDVELCSVSFKATGEWPDRADGQGSSLELIAPPSTLSTDSEIRAYLADGGNWTASSLYDGSPGRVDGFVNSVRINEVCSYPDAGDDLVELFNLGSQPVDLTGCTLTDDPDLPARWAFPSNTVLPPGGFLVVPSSQLGFAFSKLGDRALLLQMDGTNITRILDGVDFPAASPGESFGLFQRSDGVLDFSELRALTPGAANALPRVGPVVLSEILFAPASGKAEFVELANLTAAPVSLFDPSWPTNVWRLEGVGDFAFPTGTTLEPCSTLIVCSTNPAAFRAQYNVRPTLQVFGPWTGVLDDDGETLTLLRPGAPEPDGTVPYSRVDHVTYRTWLPWPPATPGGDWERVPVEAYGNDPASWRTGPVGGTPGEPATNRPPVFIVTGSTIVPQQTPLTLTLVAADLDVPWQSVTVLPTQLPAGSRFDPDLGTFSWTPSDSQGPGDFTARFEAVDTPACGPSQASLELTLHVTEPLAVTARYVEGVLQLAFPAIPGPVYAVEYCMDLALADWQLLEKATVTQSQIVTVPDPGVGQNTARFYRVRWIP